MVVGNAGFAVGTVAVVLAVGEGGTAGGSAGFTTGSGFGAGAGAGTVVGAVGVVALGAAAVWPTAGEAMMADAMPAASSMASVVRFCRFMRFLHMGGIPAGKEVDCGFRSEPLGPARHVPAAQRRLYAS